MTTVQELVQEIRRLRHPRVAVGGSCLCCREEKEKPFVDGLASYYLFREMWFSAPQPFYRRFLDRNFGVRDQALKRLWGKLLDYFTFEHAVSNACADPHVLIALAGMETADEQQQAEKMLTIGVSWILTRPSSHRLTAEAVGQLLRGLHDRSLAPKPVFQAGDPDDGCESCPSCC